MPIQLTAKVVHIKKENTVVTSSLLKKRKDAKIKTYVTERLKHIT